MSYATTTIFGHLGKDPITRAAGSDSVTSFSIAVSRTWKQNGEKKEHTTWWRVQVWGKRGQTAATYLRKGSAVIATGTPELREYEDQDRVKRHSLELLNADWSFAGGKRDDAPAAPSAPAESTSAAPSESGQPAPVGVAVGTAGDDEPPF